MSADNGQAAELVRHWSHSRKGPIVGVVVWESDKWIDIRLVGDQAIRYLSITQRLEGPTNDGEVLRVRKSFLTTVIPPGMPTQDGAR